MVVWETDPAMRSSEDHAEFADVWSAIPKVVFSHALETVEGNARLATGSVAEEVATALAATEKDVEIGGAGLAGQAVELGLVDEFRIFRYPVIVGGGTPLLPPVTDQIDLRLIETRTFSSRVIFECYGRAA
jgi:dihydrofolate reductase